MCIWVLPEDILHLDLFVPPYPSDTQNLFDLHPSLPMGYVYSDLYF